LTNHKPTAGETIQKALEQDVVYLNPWEIAGENTKPYMDELFDTMANGKKLYPNQDFFIEVAIKHERALQIVFSNKFMVKQACPEPNHDQTLYHYKHSDDALDLLWQIPDKTTCWKLYENKNYVDPSQFELLSYVMQARDGSLWKKMKKLNGEEWNSSLLEK
jgi:hypothetical protein